MPGWSHVLSSLDDTIARCSVEGAVEVMQHRKDLLVEMIVADGKSQEIDFVAFALNSYWS